MARARNQLITLDAYDFGGEMPAIHREPSRGVASAHPASRPNYSAITLGTVLVIVAVWFGVHSAGAAYEQGRADAKVEYLEETVEGLEQELAAERSENSKVRTIGLPTLDFGGNYIMPVILAIVGGSSIIIGLSKAVREGGGLLGFGFIAGLGLVAFVALS